jgi:hypothetical protein
MSINDPRWMKFGSTRLRGEEAWILNALAYLNSDGVGLVCLPTKWMTSAASKKFREKLVGLGYLQGTISLGHDFYSDNRIEMTLLILSGSGKPNRQIRIADARNIGVQETGIRDLNANDAKEIALLISTDHSDRAIDVVAEQLAKFGSPIEFNAYMAYQESKSISNPKEIQARLNRSLSKIADQYEMLAKNIREITVLDDEIKFGSQNEIHRLQDLATIEFFTRNKDEDWPSFEILPDDIILPLIHDGEKPVSPICTRPTSRTAFSTVPTAQAATAAWSRSTPSGTRAMQSEEMARYCAYPPTKPTSPKKTRCAQSGSNPDRQNRQWPQMYERWVVATRSPTLKPLT